MKVLNPGPWLEKGLMLQMTETELGSWLSEREGTTHLILSQKGKRSELRYYIVHGQPVSVAVIKDEDEKLA